MNISPTPTIELFPGVQFRKNLDNPPGNQWEFEHEGAWLIAKLAYADDIILDHIANLLEANRTTSAINEERRNLLGEARKAAGIGPFGNLAQAITAARMLLHECRTLLKEESIDYVELNAFLAGEMTAAQVIELLGDDIPDFTPGNGNKARRRAAAAGVDMDASLKAGLQVPLPDVPPARPWREIAKPVADADRLCHDPECWNCEGTGRDPDGSLCTINDDVPF